MSRSQDPIILWSYCIAPRNSARGRAPCGFSIVCDVPRVTRNRCHRLDFYTGPSIFIREARHVMFLGKTTQSTIFEACGFVDFYLEFRIIRRRRARCWSRRALPGRRHAREKIDTADRTRKRGFFRFFRPILRDDDSWKYFVSRLGSRTFNMPTLPSLF